MQGRAVAWQAKRGPALTSAPLSSRGRQGHATMLIDAIVRWLGQHYGHIVPALCCRHVESPWPLPPSSRTAASGTR